MHVMNQISIRCNRIEHCVHLRCADINEAQYTYTWTCHLHRESRLPYHITPSHPSRSWYKTPTHSTPTPPTPPLPKHRHTSNTPHVHTGLVKPKPNAVIHSPPLQPGCHESTTYTSHTLYQLLSLIYSTSASLDTILEPRVPATCPALTTTTPHTSPTSVLPLPSHPHTLSAYTHATQTTVRATTAST